MEEDIKKLDRIITRCKYCAFKECINCEISCTEAQAIENLLKEYKRVKAGRDWYFEHTVNKLVTPEMLHKILRQDYIPTSVIQKKIKKYEKMIEENPYDKPIIEIHLRELQEILEEGRK